MRTWIRLGSVAAGSLILGLLVSLFLFVELLHTPRSHTIQGLEYLSLSGILSLIAGGLALSVIARYLPSLTLKIGIAFVCGSAAAIVTVLSIPLLMFRETADLYLLVVTLVFFAAISLTFAFFVSSFTTNQLHALRQGALSVAGGNFETRLEVNGSDEVADLARAFNRMSSQIGESFARQHQMEQSRRDLIAAVSHDLRTPLASIRAMAEAINDGVVTDPESTRRYLCLIQHETEHLGTLIEDLFELSRIESGNLELRLATVPLPELVMETVDGLRIHAEEKGVLLEASCAEVPPLVLDGPRIQRVLVNLIQNAVRHTPPGGRVQVEVGRRDGHVQLAVADSGEGIAPEDQRRLFDQFYRGEKSRSRGSGGAGLGLAIARGIVEAHRGTIVVESTPGAGARFVVTL